MGIINSSIGSVSQKSNSGNTSKRFVVDDPTYRVPEELPHSYERIEVGEDEDVFKKVEEIRRQRQSLEPEKKTKLEILLGLKRKYANYELDGHVITLRNLSAKESKILIKTAFTMQEENRKVDQLYDIRNYTLAFAIFAIDDVKISDILGENDNMETRISLIEEMPENAISELHSFYEDKIAIRPPQTENEAKEVIEDIKKS